MHVRQEMSEGRQRAGNRKGRQRCGRSGRGRQGAAAAVGGAAIPPRRSAGALHVSSIRMRKHCRRRQQQCSSTGVAAIRSTPTKLVAARAPSKAPRHAIGPWLAPASLSRSAWATRRRLRCLGLFCLRQGSAWPPSAVATRCIACMAVLQSSDTHSACQDIQCHRSARSQHERAGCLCSSLFRHSRSRSEIESQISADYDIPRRSPSPP